MNSVVLEVTSRISQRSAPTRRAYLERITRMAGRAPGAERLGCANVAHAFAALPANDKFRIVVEKKAAHRCR